MTGVTTSTTTGSLVDAVLYCQSVNESSTVMLCNMKWQLFCLNLYQVSITFCVCVCASYRVVCCCLYSITVIVELKV